VLADISQSKAKAHTQKQCSFFAFNLCCMLPTSRETKVPDTRMTLNVTVNDVISHAQARKTGAKFMATVS